ncbi:MAG: hypothetical protein HQK83_02385 [Fibrobacteria bacterium]|nr:hypothetical protein [Fibrobacteria bacterium]
MISKIFSLTGLAAGILFFIGCSGSKPAGPPIFSPADMNNPAARQKVAEAYINAKDIEKLNGVKKVIIPAFNVEFITQSSGTATSSDYKKGTASVTNIYSLAGLDTAMLQAIADDLHTKLVDKLKASGIDVVSVSELTSAEAYTAMSFEDTPRKGKSYLDKGKARSLTFAPKDMKVYYTAGDPFAPMTSAFGQAFKGASGKANNNMEAKLMKDFNADAMLKVRYVAGFAEIDKKTSKSVNKVSAKVSASMGFSLAIGSNRLVFTKGFTESPKPGKKDEFVYTPSGEITSVDLKLPITSDAPIVSEVVESTSTWGKISNVLSVVIGSLSGGVFTKYTFDAKVDNDTYKKTSVDYIGTFNELAIEQLKLAPPALAAPPEPAAIEATTEEADPAEQAEEAKPAEEAQEKAAPEAAPAEAEPAPAE